MRTCPYTNQLGQPCGQPFGHKLEHGNGLLTPGPQQVWSIPVPRCFCLKPSDPSTPQLIAIWLTMARRLHVNVDKIVDAERLLFEINNYQIDAGTKVPD